MKQNEQAMIIDGHEEARASRELTRGRNTADVGHCEVVPTSTIRTVTALRSVICAARKYRYERLFKLHIGRLGPEAREL